jgi:hypothetical protein
MIQYGLRGLAEVTLKETRLKTEEFSGKDHFES